ncbi:MAG TPA: hypothetical protein VEA78_04950, partial [Acidimicrobiales bacterium]|nr:hypothetical protein [Acidimicrobiales bacterium]
MSIRDRLTRRRRTPGVDAMGADWVKPHWLEREVAAGDRRWTDIGTIAARPEATVDPRGLVTPTGGSWSLDWWIGADDRWHLPSREIAVRQRLIDDMPVVETSMRVPGGDAIQRVYGVHDGDDELVVVEIENASKLPFAVALAVRPYDARGVAPIERIGLDGTTVTVDGRAAVLLPSRPRHVAASTSADGDVSSVVLAGDAGTELPSELLDAEGMATAAFLFPLAHTATLRVALPRHRPAREITAYPTAAQVANGWSVHAGRGMRLELPDARLASCVTALRARALLVRDVAALDLYGHRREAADALRSLAHRDDADVEDLRAIAEHWRLHRDRSVVDPLVDTVAATAERDGRRSPSALHDAAVVLRAAGEERAAADAERLAGGAPVERRPAPSLRRLDELLTSASPTWTWGEDERAAASELLTLARDLLVRETDDGLALLSAVPDPWLGQGFEVHGAPTHGGTLSYAVRWHGERPALLWELDPHDA